MRNVFRIVLLVLALGVLPSVYGQQTAASQFRFAFFASGEVPNLTFTGFAGDVPLELRVGLTSGFTFVNPGAEDAQVQIRFIGLDGEEVDIPLILVPATEPLFVPLFAARETLSPLPTGGAQTAPPFGDAPLDNPFTLPPGASLTAFADFRALASLTAGTVGIESDSPIGAVQLLANFIAFEDPELGISAVISPTPPVSVSPAEPVNRFRIAASHNQLVSSGVSLTIADQETDSVSGTLRLLTTGGLEVASRTVEVRRGAQFVQKFEELFPDAPFSDGTLVGEFDGPLLVGSVSFTVFGLLDRSNLIVAGQ